MTDTKVRFVKNAKLSMVSDFNDTVVDSFNNLVNSMRKLHKTDFEISDFAYLFDISGLTKVARTNYIDNDCNIKFTSITVNQVKHRDSKPFALKDKLLHVEVWYVAFSDYYTTYKEEDTKSYYFEKDEVKYEFNKEKLNTCNITV